MSPVNWGVNSGGVVIYSPEQWTHFFQCPFSTCLLRWQRKVLFGCMGHILVRKAGGTIGSLQMIGSADPRVQIHRRVLAWLHHPPAFMIVLGLLCPVSLQGVPRGRDIQPGLTPWFRRLAMRTWPGFATSEPGPGRSEISAAPGRVALGVAKLSMTGPVDVVPR